MKLINSFLKKCYELLRENGIVLLTTLNLESYLVKLGRKGVFKDPSHVSIMPPKYLSYLEKNKLLESNNRRKWKRHKFFSRIFSFALCIWQLFNNRDKVINRV